ncbi:hypothetical protein GPZ77_00050 [Streptomyces sp. QHH-9511]|uniref:hypothetical protein n=1 Tax=Streptomyces sp. QHH-9511 TaxID=2684468 RepID=UPI001319868F|nr:hypothetical protein [Streptomyces sp. QHH-9511]QGZ47032.1 hypothetical protein GPZ77_00050 [Streptomyces sp. QHH-9511]
MLSELTSGPGASCVTLNPVISSGWHSVRCALEPGDHTIGYRLTAPATAHTFKREAVVWHNIYSPHIPFEPVESAGPFSVSGAPVHPDHGLLGRDATGALYFYAGSGNAGRPFVERRRLSGSWQTYNALTRLSPMAEDLQYGNGVPAKAMRGRGDLITRDASGTLWYHHRQNLNNGEPYAPAPTTANPTPSPATRPETSGCTRALATPPPPSPPAPRPVPAGTSTTGSSDPTSLQGHRVFSL